MQISTTVKDMHRLLYIYNGFVIFILAIFMCLTQDKINQSMAARSFLERVSALPVSSMEILITTTLSFISLLIVGQLYRTINKNISYWRYILFIIEIIVCMFLLRSLNLSYDGIVLLVVADLMYRYEGHHQEYILLAAMIGLYFIANYNLAVFQSKTISFEGYVSYYNAATQAILLAIKNVFSSINIVFFVYYLVMLVKNKHEEKERIRLLNEKLEEANQRLRAYAIEVEQMAETRERNRLAREIHDTLGHSLTGIAAGLDACILMIDAAPEATKQQLTKIRETARKGIVDVRRSVKKLRPDDLERLPFQEALMQMTKDYSESSGMEIIFNIYNWPENLRQDQEDVIYRVLQESITNSNRHGHAKRVKITVGGDKNVLIVIISDNGEGCNDVKHGFGLRHMRERLELLHGSVNYWSDEGFIVEAMIPLNQEAHYDKNNNC